MVEVRNVLEFQRESLEGYVDGRKGEKDKQRKWEVVNGLKSKER